MAWAWWSSRISPLLRASDRRARKTSALGRSSIDVALDQYGLLGAHASREKHFLVFETHRAFDQVIRPRLYLVVDLGDVLADDAEADHDQAAENKQRRDDGGEA